MQSLQLLLDLGLGLAAGPPAPFLLRFPSAEAQGHNTALPAGADPLVAAVRPVAHAIEAGAIFAGAAKPAAELSNGVTLPLGSRPAFVLPTGENDSRM